MERAEAGCLDDRHQPFPQPCGGCCGEQGGVFLKILMDTLFNILDYIVQGRWGGNFDEWAYKVNQDEVGGAKKIGQTWTSRVES